MSEIQILIAKIPALRGKRVGVAPLEGGLTNRNFLLTANGERFVLRVAGENTALLGINRLTEYECASAAFRAGVGAEAVAFLPEDEALVTRFIEGRVLTPEDVRLPAMMRRVGTSLRRYHESSAGAGRFWAFDRVREYHALAQQHGVRFPSELRAALEKFARVERAVGAPDLRWPCHNDLMTVNFIDDGVTVRIIDWEYAGMGDRFFDLGNLAAKSVFSNDEERALLSLYFGEVRTEHLRRLQWMRLATDMFEAMWGFLQTGISKLDFDYPSYARRHLQRFLTQSQHMDL